MLERKLKTWDKFFLAVVLIILLVEFGIGDIENFYFTFSMYDKTDLTSLK